jgi:hypothetical protein
VSWFAPPDPILRSVEIVDSPEPLALGERRPLHARLVGSDGRLRSDSVTWRALETGVVSVSPEGIITGNRPGTGRIVATAGVWRADTLVVQVGEDATGPDLLLQDHFDRIDPEVWAPVGFPHPYPVILEDGAPALRIPGDGHDRDGLQTRAGFSLHQGLTVELSVRLPLSRRDRQAMALVLFNRREAQDTTMIGGDWDQAVMVAHPGQELERFDPRILGVNVNRFSFMFPLPPEANPGDWMRFALEVQPDGQVTVRVNGTTAGSVPLHLDIQPGDEWRLAITGASVDTELVVRDLLVWRGVR